MTELSPVPAADGLEIGLDGPIVRVVIRRAPHNRISLEMCRALTDLLDAPPGGARVMHLRADGPVFCLGRDRGSPNEGAMREQAEALVKLNRALRRGKLVTVAEVPGDAAGYGVGLAALSDLSFVAPSARFWFPEVEAGLAPTVVLGWLPFLVGRSQAFRLTATGAPIDGREAARLGLVTAVADSDEDLSRLVAAEIEMLTRHPFQPQLEIRAFLQETLGSKERSIDRLSVDRLVHNSLRFIEANPEPPQ